MLARIAVVAAVLLALVPLGMSRAGAAPPGEWPMYGADTSNTRTVAGGPSPTAVLLHLHQVWRLDITDGDFTGTPVVSGGVVYVGGNGGVVRALEASNGHLLWKAHVPAGVNGSLAVSGGSVFVPVARVGSPAVVALSAATGAVQWTAVLDTSADADVYASPIPTTIGTRPVVLEGVSAVVGDPASPLRGSLSALDAVTGQLVWKSYMVPPGFNGGAVWSTPAVDRTHGAVFVGTGNAYSGFAVRTTDAIVKLDLTTGAILGSLQGTGGDVFSSSTPGLDFDFGASPNLFTIGGRAVVGEGAKSGVYWVADRATMQPVWHTQLGIGSVVGGILGSTAYDNGHVIGPESLPGYLWSVSAANGLPNWITTGLLDVAHLTPVAVSNGVVYSVAASGFLEAFLEATGTPIAEQPLKLGSVALDGGVAVADGKVFADLGSQGSSGAVVAFAA